MQAIKSVSIFPENLKQAGVLQSVFMVLLASAVIALSGRIAIPLPFTPVPVALQPHVVLLMGIMLGSKRGFLATLIFLAQGACGLPVFSTIPSGFAAFLGPTGGYLIGYALAAFASGWIFERLQNKGSGRAVLFAFFGGNAIIYIPALLWLSVFVGAGQVVTLGLLPFILGDLLKVFACASLYKSASMLRS